MDTAVILAGGLGTRLRPLTLEIPKPLVPVQGKTLTEQVIDKLKEAGVKKIYLSIGYKAKQIQEYFSDKELGVEINYLIEKERLGTGGWLKLLSREQIDQDFSQDFIVVNGDNLFDLDWGKMYADHKKTDALITIALTKVDDVSHYGVVDIEDNWIKGFVEKPKPKDAPSNLISSGYYIFSNKIFEELPVEKKFMLEKDVFPQIAEKGKLLGYPDPGQWFDTGTFERWEEVIKKWKK